MISEAMLMIADLTENATSNGIFHLLLTFPNLGMKLTSEGSLTIAESRFPLIEEAIVNHN